MIKRRQLDAIIRDISYTLIKKKYNKKILRIVTCAYILLFALITIVIIIIIIIYFVQYTTS